MILVDTCVWIEHLRQGSAALVRQLAAGHVICHPFVIGELACGHLRNRNKILALLSDLPHANVASHDEVLHFIDMYQLMGKGLVSMDVHLLTSAALTGIQIWTSDKRLARIADSLSLTGPG